MSETPKTRRVVYDPLTELMAYYATHTAAKKEPAAVSAAVEDRLKQRVIDGDRVGLQTDLEEALRTLPGSGDHQHHPAGRYEDRRGAVRERTDAAPLCAAVG